MWICPENPLNIFRIKPVSQDKYYYRNAKGDHKMLVLIIANIAMSIMNLHLFTLNFGTLIALNFENLSFFKLKGFKIFIYLPSFKGKFLTKTIYNEQSSILSYGFDICSERDIIWAIYGKSYFVIQ